MTAWNPNDPDVIGPEFFGGTESFVTPQGWAPVSQRFTSAAAETVAAVRLHYKVDGVLATPTWLAEVCAAGDEADDGAFTVATYAPNVLTNIIGVVTGAVADIDEWPPVYTDRVDIDPNSSCDVEFAVAALPTAGRIVSVGFQVVSCWGVPPDSGGLTWGSQYRTLTASLVNAGTLYGTMTRTIPLNNQFGQTGRTFFTWGEINPITGQAWTVADVAAIDTATTRIRMAKGNTAAQLRIAAVRLVVVYEPVERRVATGSFLATTAAAGWTANIPLQTPAGAANWAKANGVDYAMVVRQADQGSLNNPLNSNVLSATTVQAIAGNEPPASLVSYDVATSFAAFLVDGGATLSGFMAGAASAVSGRVLPFVLRTTAPATSADGQPYSEIKNTPVYTGSGSTQGELRTTGVGPVAALRIAVGWFTGMPTADLVVDVRKRSDSSLAGSFSIDPGVLAATPIGQLVLVEVEYPDPGFGLLAATQYYLDFSSATPSGLDWIVGLLAVNPVGGGVLYQEATYGGGTDEASPILGTVSTAMSYPPADFVAVLDRAMAGPGAFAAVASSVAVAQPTVVHGRACSVTEIPTVSLSWTATALGGSFGYYQLEREHPDAGWQPIAVITDEAVTGFEDHEGRIGVVESYRIKVFATTGASSYWSATVTATAAVVDCGYTFTSNEDPTLCVGYPDVYGDEADRDYGFSEADEVEFRTLYGRDYVVAFRPLSFRGVSFTRTLLLGALAAPLAGVGPAAVEALRALARASLSYVCVRDEVGNRWYGSIAVPDLSTIQPTQLHRATLAFVETTATPSTPNSAVC